MTDAYTYHFIFIDIVGLSEPQLSTEEQITKIKALNESIKSCTAFNSIPKDKLVILPTGDGSAIGFPDKINLPLDLAIELHKKLRMYNESKSFKEAIRVRIGIHSAPVMIVKDLLENDNYWGDGIILARRIMDVGEADHILLSEHIGEQLAKLSLYYKKMLYHAGTATFKHGRKEFVWLAYGDGFGNNETSRIKELNKQAQDYDFSAEILEKKQFRLGETVRTKIHFKGTLQGGFYDNMFRAPKGKTFPWGGSDWWCPDPNTSPTTAGQGKLIGEVDKESTWGCTIPLDYPTGEYVVYIRVYDHLPNGQRPVIRERVETIEIME